MAIAWKRAVEVAKGDEITSTQLATLATAFNDRLRSGIADCSWRIFFWWLSLFRQVRNSDETGFVFPSMGEYFELYQHIDPRDAVWPDAGPGDPEGSNVANQMNAFVFGGSAFQINDEADRFALMAWPQGVPSPRDAWDHAKQQRGGYDPRTGGVASPALLVAQEHYRIRYGMKSPHGLSYGGWFPRPDLGAPCEDPNPGDSEDPNPNYLIKFTSLINGSSITFNGSCEPAGEDFPYDDHVAFVARMPWAAYVFLNDGSLSVFPTNEWVEGPYEGEGVLQKAENGAIGRVLNNFVREFRGAHEDRKSQKYHLQHAFDFQKFFTTQYHLAPQRGVEIDGFVDPLYPTAKSEGVPTEGSFLIWDTTTTTTNGWHEGFVLTGYLIEIEGMSGFVNIELLDEEEVVEVVTIVPDETGKGATLRMVDEAWTPSVLEWRIKDLPSDVDSNSKIKVECTELWGYKPTVEDAYVVLRASATLPTEPDGVGDNETQSEILSDDYFDFGCIINRAGQPGLRGNFAEVNTNAVFDATRRWSKMVRLIRRQEFVGYAIEGGKSVLYFKRFAFGLHNATPADIFDGIGPSRERIVKGGIEPGYVYENRAEDSIDYNGKTVKQGERFTGVAGVPSWEGEGSVFEADGIRHTAPPNGYTNEWLIGFEFKGYHTSYSSLWKSDAYSDYFPLSNRCMFYAPEVATDPPLLLHTSFNERVGGSGTIAPEAPSGFNYTKLEDIWLTNDHTHLNQLFCNEGDTTCEQLRRDFYASCRVYEPDAEVESCEVESTDEAGNEIIKLTLTKRIHHCSVAPSSIDKDPATWDVGALEAEPFRSHENALRQYIIHQTTGRQCDWEIPGNTGINSDLYSNTDAPFGSCFPHFRMVKLVPLPYDDGNNKQNQTDTRFEHDFFPMMELYLKCMAEGFIDGTTSAAHACEYGTFSAFDFTFTNLCVQAFGNKWFTTLRREDNELNPQGYGPLPNTEAFAEVFNQFVKAINLLTTVRVNIPAKLQCQLVTSESFGALGMKNAGGEDQGCSNGILAAWGFGEFGGGGGSTTAGAWDDCAGGLGSVTAGVNPTGVCVGSAFEIKSSRTTISFRWIPLDPDALTYALPSEWSDMLVSDATILAITTNSTSVLNKSVSTDPSQGGSTQCCPESGGDCPAFIVSPGVYLNFDGPTTADPQGCGLFTGGFGPPPVPASHMFYVQGPDPTPCPSGPSSQVEYVILTTTIPMITIPLV